MDAERPYRNEQDAPACAGASCLISAYPKGKLLDIMKELNGVELASPVAIGQVALKDAAGTGANVVVTKAL